MLKFFEIFQFKQLRQNKEIDRIDNSVLHMSPIADECRLVYRKEKFKEENSERYKHYVRGHNLAKYNIKFFLELGANPNILDCKNKTYKDILNMTFTDNIHR